jgi:hypothetical protein
MSILPKDSKSRKYILLGFRIMGNFGATIAIPVILFVIFGQWLESKFGHEPYFTIAGFVIAALLTAVMIKKKAKQFAKEYHDLNNNL